MAFMMPVVKNDWDIYNSQRSRRASESAERAGPGRSRKVSESRSEGPGMSPRCNAALSPHRSAPAMRSLNYNRAPPSRTIRPEHKSNQNSNQTRATMAPSEKFHNRLVEKLKKAMGRSESRGDERTS